MERPNHNSLDTMEFTEVSHLYMFVCVTSVVFQSKAEFASRVQLAQFSGI